MKFCSDRLNTQPMTMEIMRVVSELTSLKAMELYEKMLDPETFRALCSESFASLRILNMDKGRLTDPGLTLLKNLKSLEELKLTQASITHVGLKRING